MNKWISAFIVPTTLFLSAMPLHALAQTSSAELGIDCTDPQDQMSMNICSYEDWQAADKELNAVWKVVRNQMKETDEFLSEEMRGADAALLKSQRAWIDYRDGTCEAEGFQARGGTLEPLLVNSCRARLTKARTAELREISPDR